MFPNLLLNAHNRFFEVGFAPLNVTSYVQVESVDMGEARKRNYAANVKKNNVKQLQNQVYQVNQVRNAAETRIETPPVPILQLLQLFWS